MKAAIGILLLSALAATAPAVASVFHVPAEYPSIQSALAAAAAGDTVLVACGTYYEHGLSPRESCLIRGEGGSADCVVIDAQEQGSCIIAQARYVRLEHLTLRNGYSNYRGGGLDAGIVPSLVDVVVENCFAAQDGGGVSASGIAFQDLVLRNNRADRGGGLFLLEYGGASSGLLAVGNEAESGAAIYIQDCMWPSNAKLDGLTLVGNRSTAGEGILTMSAMTGEWVNWLAVSRSIFADNEGFALACPGGWFNMYDVSDPAGSEMDAFVSSSCFWNNSLGDFGGEIADLTGFYGNLFVDPRFCTPELGNYALREDSPCLPEGNLCRVTMGAIGEPCVLTGVEAEAGAPAAFRVGSFPNPFNPSTQIRFVLPRAARVSLRVFDIAGRRVATLLDGARRDAGEQALVWDGRDDAGQALPSGVYLYRLEAGELRATRKLTLLK